jgi:fructose-1,6-bisphosphatase I
METLQTFLEDQVQRPVSKIFRAVALASLEVWRRIPISTEASSGVNSSGDTQTNIDLFANERFSAGLLATSEVAEIASEELDEPVPGNGSLHISMDPLDGSSNIPTNNPLGSIFAVYDESLPCSGESIVAAAYITYGPMLTLTLSAGHAVNRFTAIWDGKGYVFNLTQAEIKLPEKAVVYGLGGSRKDWVEPVERFVRGLEKRGLKLRYGGTFVGDYNQVQHYGGIFGYPALKNKPKGKLRVLYEIHPMAFITKQSGGYSSDGERNVLDLKPAELTETSPAFFGSRPLVEELETQMSD